MRNNSFDLMRHFAAFMVLYSHHYVLCGFTEPLFINWNTYGFLAVVMFFSMSGYFMPQSFTSSGSFLVYLSKRCRRIFPGLVVCTFLMCYVIGPIFTPLPALKYLLSYSTFKLWTLYVLLHGLPIDGVFSEFLYPNAINGSLWTLCTEFTSYIILGLALCLSNSWKSILFLLVTCLIMTFMIVFNKIEDFYFYSIFGKYLVMFGIAFTTGALMSVTQTLWFKRKLLIGTFALVLLWMIQGKPALPIIGTLCLAVITILLGVSYKDNIIKARFDISYGIYIYAFPIQQLVINLLTKNFWHSFFISITLTTMAAYLSYRLVEEPFLYANKKETKKNCLPSSVEA